MYEPIPFDKNIVSQSWFKRMQFEHKWLLFYTWLKCDKIGILEPDLEDFCRTFSNGFFNESDIDLIRFSEDANSDGKERIHLIDEGRRIWFAPTVIFRNSNKAGFRKLNSSDRDAAIVNALAQRKETRSWLIHELSKDSRLTIDPKLIEKIAYYSYENDKTLKFAKDIAKSVGYKLKPTKELPDTIKSNYGHMCQYCGGVFESFDLEIDHVIPRSSEGPDRYINKVPACQECNQKKGRKSVFLFMKEMDFEWTKGLQNIVDKLVRKGLLDYPSHYPFKKNKRKKLLTYSEVVNISQNPRDNREMKDFETTDQLDTKGKPIWIQKN